MLSEGLKDKIKDYHKKGYSYRMIHFLVENEYNCQISYFQKKIIPGLGLRRRGLLNCSFEQVLQASVFEIGNGLAGSEQLRRTLAVKYNMRIPRVLSRDMVRFIDGEGVARRKGHRLRRRIYISKGPNYAWHLDGYDKLAPFGIYIHGCIDGFSRKIVWLHAGITNRRPEVVATYFLNAVEREGGFPRKLRGDHGTENSRVALIMRETMGHVEAFRYGRSTSNQRIERWWGHLRQARADFWIHEFKIMEAEGILLKDNPIHRLCLQYCFIPFIQAQLKELKELWNTHSIRAQRDLRTKFAGTGKKNSTDKNFSLHTLTDVLRFNVEEEETCAPDHKSFIAPDLIRTMKERCQTNFLLLDSDILAIADDVVNKLQLPTPEQLKSFSHCKHHFIALTEIFNKLELY